jgi:hypothetical protein
VEFPFGQTVFRDRKPLITDPYNPSRQIRGPFDVSLTISLPGAFVASPSNQIPPLPDATRSQLLTRKSLYLTNPDADVIKGDRIRVGGTHSDMESGDPYFVDERPAADVNPFTGWQPAVEIPLKLTEG